MTRNHVLFLLHPRARDLVPELQPIDDVHAGDDATEGGEVAFVVGLRRAAERVAWITGIEAGRRPAERATQQPEPAHFVPEPLVGANRALLRDEIGDDASELGADDVTGGDDGDEILDAERRVAKSHVERVAKSQVGRGFSPASTPALKSRPTC